MWFQNFYFKGYCVRTFPSRNNHIKGIAQPKPGTLTGSERKKKVCTISVLDSKSIKKGLKKDSCISTDLKFLHGK